MPSESKGKGELSREKIKQHGKLDLFSPFWRLGRIRYIAYSFVAAILAFCLINLSVQISSAIPNSLSALFLGFSFVLIYGGLALIIVVLTIKRCHDFDTSGWLSLLLLLPFGMLVFWFIPGTDSVNRFGRDMPENSTFEKILAASTIVFILYSAASVFYQIIG